MEHDITMFAGVTTVYLEDVDFECRSRKPRATPAPVVEHALERILATLENDLRIANLGTAWSPR